MADVAALIADMVRAGVDPELIGRTAAALSEREAVLVHDEAAETRRAKDRDRKRLRKSAEIGGIRGPDEEPSLPSKEIPQTPKETQPTLPTTHKEKTPKGVQKKGSRLPPDWVLPEGWGIDAIEAGLPSNRIDLEASKMRDWSLSSKAGVKLDWRATWRNWCREAASRPMPRGSPPLRMDDFLGAVIDHQERQNAGPDRKIEGPPQALRAIPGGRWTG